MVHSRTGQRRTASSRSSQSPPRRTEWVSAYNLCIKRLEAWLDKNFPGSYELHDYDRDGESTCSTRVTVAEPLYTVVLPRKLTDEEKAAIGRLRRSRKRRRKEYRKNESSDEDEGEDDKSLLSGRHSVSPNDTGSPTYPPAGSQSQSTVTSSTQSSRPLKPGTGRRDKPHPGGQEKKESGRCVIL